LYWIVLPLLVRGIGVISSIVGTYAVSLWRVDDAEEAMYKSYEVSSGITIISTFLVAWLYAGQLSLATLVAVGVALAVAFNPLTSYATSAKSSRVQTISASTRFGPASVILEGLSLGYLSACGRVRDCGEPHGFDRVTASTSPMSTTHRGAGRCGIVVHPNRARPEKGHW